MTVYNPVSIGRFFNSGCRFDNYWEQTGVSSLAVTLAKRYDLLSLAREEADVGLGSFTSFDISLIAGDGLTKDSVYALLYYTGYLTIADGDDEGLTLRFPNREVSSSFTKALASRYIGADAGSIVYRGSRALAKGDMAAFMDAVDAYISAFPYQLFERQDERTFHLIFHSYLVALGGRAYAEDAGRIGRADEVYERERAIYVFELKVDKSADEALRQIKEKGYADKYMERARKEGKRIALIGVAFSSAERRITDYREEIL